MGQHLRAVAEDSRTLFGREKAVGIFRHFLDILGFFPTRLGQRGQPVATVKKASRADRTRKDVLMGRVGLALGVVVEELGGDLMVMVPGSTEVLTLSGDATEAVRLVQSGSPVATDALVSDLVRLGVLETSGLSRRGLIKAGAIGAGAGIAVMATPSVAMAASRGELSFSDASVRSTAGFSSDNDPVTELTFRINGLDTGFDADGAQWTLTLNAGQGVSFSPVVMTYNASNNRLEGSTTDLIQVLFRNIPDPLTGTLTRPAGQGPFTISFEKAS